MTGEDFILNVKVKLNRLDSSSYEDVRPEEILFFSQDALKSLTLGFDIGEYSPKIDLAAINIYLATLISHNPEVLLVDNTISLSSEVLKIKDLEVFVTIGDETGWMPTRELTNIRTSDRQDNPFTTSYPDRPAYRLIDNTIKFDVSNFTCSKIRYDYLKMPEIILEDTVLTYPFMSELEDKTVTLLLENLEAQRIQTQPIVSKS